jgi:hypothetical protein
MGRRESDVQWGEQNTTGTKKKGKEAETSPVQNRERKWREQNIIAFQSATKGRV